MADDEPTKPPSGCAACGYADGGCSLCSGMSVLELMRSHDDAEAVFDQAIAAKVDAAALAAHAAVPAPTPHGIFRPPPGPVFAEALELALTGGRLVVKLGPTTVTVPTDVHQHVGDGPATYAAIGPDRVAAAVEAFCRATGYYPTPPGAGR